MTDSTYRSTLGDRLEGVIAGLDGDSLTLGQMLDHVGTQGLLLLAALLTLVFLIPVSIPGVSTVFGAAILLIGVSRLLDRPLWLPARLRNRELPAERVREMLGRGMTWVHRMERISRRHRMPGLAEGRAMDIINSLAFIFAAILLMMPFGFIPFSNTLPGIALLFYAVGMIQRDGVAILLGHLGTVVTVVYFTFLIAGGGWALLALWQHFSG
ncbi:MULTISPECIES: exopolysaccharide biosynthesis protein [unclassified Luteimonas]